MKYKVSYRCFNRYGKDIDYTARVVFEETVKATSPQRAINYAVSQLKSVYEKAGFLIDTTDDKPTDRKFVVEGGDETRAYCWVFCDFEATEDNHIMTEDEIINAKINILSDLTEEEVTYDEEQDVFIVYNGPGFTID